MTELILQSVMEASVDSAVQTQQLAAEEQAAAAILAEMALKYIMDAAEESALQMQKEAATNILLEQNVYKISDTVEADHFVKVLRIGPAFDKENAYNY